VILKADEVILPLESRRPDFFWSSHPSVKECKGMGYYLCRLQAGQSPYVITVSFPLDSRELVIIAGLILSNFKGFTDRDQLLSFERP
jgi:hypothetical protein